MSNIRLTNNVKLSSDSMQFCIDPSNLLASSNGVNAYTTTQDCFVTATTVNAAYNEANTSAAGVGLSLGSVKGSILCGYFRSGVQIAMTNSNGTQNIKVFGLK